MIIVHVTVEVKPEQQDQFIAMMDGFIADALEIDTCQSFILYQQAKNASRFGLYEEWDSADAFTAYTQTEQFAQFRESLGPMLAAPPVSNRFEAQRIEA